MIALGLTCLDRGRLIPHLFQKDHSGFWKVVNLMFLTHSYQGMFYAALGRCYKVVFRFDLRFHGNKHQRFFALIGLPD